MTEAACPTRRAASSRFPVASSQSAFATGRRICDMRLQIGPPRRHRTDGRMNGKTVLQGATISISVSVSELASHQGPQEFDPDSDADPVPDKISTGSPPESL